jgi:hypothetical protein
MLIVPGIAAGQTCLAGVCERYGIAEVKVFGTRARGQAAPDSDAGIRCAGHSTPAMKAPEPDQTDEPSGQVAPPNVKATLPKPTAVTSDATESASRKVNEPQTATTARPH